MLKELLKCSSIMFTLSCPEHGEIMLELHVRVSFHPPGVRGLRTRLLL